MKNLKISKAKFSQREKISTHLPQLLKELYKHKELFEDALREVFEDFPTMFADAMNNPLIKKITQHELYGVVDSMANGKIPQHDGILLKS